MWRTNPEIRNVTRHIVIQLKNGWALDEKTCEAVSLDGDRILLDTFPSGVATLRASDAPPGPTGQFVEIYPENQSDLQGLLDHLNSIEGIHEAYLAPLMGPG